MTGRGRPATRPRVGFAGLGIIGSAFSKHLRAAGFDVAGFDPDPARRALLARRGGRSQSTLAACVRGSDVLITALASEAVYEQVMAGHRGIATNARRGLVVCDVSTMPVELKCTMRATLGKRGVTLLDCPISGTGAQAENRDVAVYASGPRRAVERVRPVLEGFSRQVWYAGEFGAGSKLKFVANLLVTIHNVAAAEALTLGIKAGLDPELMLAALASGAGTSRMLEVRGPLMLADRYDQPTMKCDVYQKDIDIIGAYATRLRCPTPLFDASRSLYAAALAQGRDKQDTAAVCAVLKGMAGLDGPTARPRRSNAARQRRKTTA